MKALIVALAALMLTGCGIGSVGPGERAVFATWGKVDPTCYQGGKLYTYNPFSTSMYTVDTKVQKYEALKLAAASKDLQEIHADVVLNFLLDPSKCSELISTVGTDFKDRVIVPAVVEVLKASTAQFPIEKVIQERAALKTMIVNGLSTRLSPYFITVRDVSLTNFTFSEGYQRAVEAKQIEEQGVQKQEYVRQQAEKEAQARVARVKGEAEANRLLAESLRSSPETLRFKELEVMGQRWDGKLPQTILGGTGALVTIPSTR